MKSEVSQVIYKDRILWIAFYPLSAISFLFFANDNPMAKLIRLPSFFTDLVFALLITFSSGLYVRQVILHLDKKYPWQENLKTRLWLQTLYGILAPLLVVMILEVLYLMAININFANSSILNLELPLAFLLLLLVNSFYVGVYLFQNKKTEIITVEKIITLENKVTIPYFVVQKGFNELKIETTDCAFIKSREKLLWLYTFDNEVYRLDGTLEEWEKKLESSFFRINRQYLTSAEAIQAVTATETRKLKVDFVIPVNDAVYISKTNTSDFRKWWKK